MSGLDRLWAPWRSGYIVKARKGTLTCVFCAAKRTRDDRAMHVVYRGREVFALLNRFPYNAGHLMVAPYRHTGDFTALTPSEAAELMEAAQRMIVRLKQVVRPHGVNLGMNLGRLAGAGIPGHLHLHVVPRWTGDTNFMPVIGHTRVVSQSLDALYDRLQQADR